MTETTHETSTPREFKPGDKVVVITTVDDTPCYRGSVHLKEITEAQIPERVKTDPTPMLEEFVNEFTSVLEDSYYCSELKERRAKTRAILAKAKAWLEGR